MDKKCPYCGAETRPGDNFCLNCGNRLLPVTPSSAFPPAPPGVGEEHTVEAPENWADAGGATIPAPASDAGLPIYHGESAPAAQAILEKIEQPARLILRSEEGEVVQEYVLDKPETVIGRAPGSDILLSKDKLTSRRHATIRYEDKQYVLRDERSANGTFVNGQQIEELVPYVLKDGDHVGIGEHELIFRAAGSQQAVQEKESAPPVPIDELVTVAQPFSPSAVSPVPQEPTYRTQSDGQATIPAPEQDDFKTQGTTTNGVPGSVAPAVPVIPPTVRDAAPAAPAAPVIPPTVREAPPAPVIEPTVREPAPPVPDTPQPSTSVPPAIERSSTPPVTERKETEQPAPPPARGKASGVTLNRFTDLPQPVLPDMTALMAALSSLDGQISSLQQQFHETQEAMRSHEVEIARTTDQLRADLRRICDRMDTTIAEGGHSRDALAWSELVQAVEDVVNNPRDVEYMVKLAKKARDLSRLFQLYQNVLSTMAECNSQLRSMLGDSKNK
ncbi:MAG: FHA domain-containing protein [Ktedonobacteraceae bacterium]|nr:FHA domain-containing protein [Ktedonobacteraceae bacterium]